MARCVLGERSRADCGCYPGCCCCGGGGGGGGGGWREAESGVIGAFSERGWGKEREKESQGKGEGASDTSMGVE